MILKKKPRVLILYDFPIQGGGSGIYVKYLALRLKEIYKYDIAFAAPDKNPFDPSISHYYLNLPQVPVFISRPGLEGAKKYNELSSMEIANLYSAFIKETMRAVDEFKPDIIHVHHIIINAWAARFIRSLFGVKLIITSHGSCLHAISKDKRYMRMTRDALRAANAITVVSGDTRVKLLKTFGSDLSPKTRTITGGIRLSLFPEKQSAKDLEVIAHNFNLGDKPIVLFSGRLINEKGVEYLVKAASRIKGQIVIAGGGPQKENLEKIIKEKSILNVKLLGYLEHEDLLGLYYLSDVFVSPSVWDDPMPLAVLEAMAAGLPVVITRRGGITIAVKDGYNGFFVRSRNATDIAQKVNKLLEDKDLRKRMGEHARATVLKKFTWSHIARKFHALYSKV